MEATLASELRQVAAAALRYAAPGEELVGVVPAEPIGGVYVYLCAYRAGGDATSWLALDAERRPVESRSLVRDAVSIVGMCELAEEAAGGGDLDELRSQLVALRLTENPPGIDEAEEAIDELEAALGSPPETASPARLDSIGVATRRLEQALGNGGGSPFAGAMRQAIGSVDALVKDVEAGYRLPLN